MFVYGNAIGPYAPGKSVYNRYTENKETLVPRSGVKKTNYDKINPYRPVEPRAVPKQEFVPPPEKEKSFNLVFNRPDQPVQKEPTNPDSEQQFEQFAPYSAQLMDVDIKTPKDEKDVVMKKEKPNLRIITDRHFTADNVTKPQSVHSMNRPLNTKDDIIGDTGFTPIFTPSSTQSDVIGGLGRVNGIFNEDHRKSAPSIMTTRTLLGNSVVAEPAEEFGIVPNLSSRDTSKFKGKGAKKNESDIEPDLVGRAIDAARNREFLKSMEGVSIKTSRQFEKSRKSAYADIPLSVQRKQILKDAKQVKKNEVLAKRAFRASLAVPGQSGAGTVINPIVLSSPEVQFVSEKILQNTRINDTISANGDGIKKSTSPRTSPAEVLRGYGLGSVSSSSGSNEPERGFGLARPSVGPVIPNSSTSSSGPDIPEPRRSRRVAPKKPAPVVPVKTTKTSKNMTHKKKPVKRSARYKKAREQGESSGSNYSDK